VWGEGGLPSQLDIFTAEIILQIDEFSFSVFFFHPAQKIFFLILAKHTYQHKQIHFGRVSDPYSFDTDPDPWGFDDKKLEKFTAEKTAKFF
jgi:hypothetical protein